MGEGPWEILLTLCYCSSLSMSPAQGSPQSWCMKNEKGKEMHLGSEEGALGEVAKHGEITN